MRKGGLACLLGLMLAGCAAVTLPPTGDRRVEMLAPLEKALTLNHEALEAEAASGDVVSQYALSIALEHGLQGSPIDADQARAWRSVSLNTTTSRPAGIYMPGVNGQPGRTSVVQIRGLVIIPYQVLVVDGCVSHLSGDDPSPKWCGSTEEASVLSDQWRRARSN